MRVVVKVLESLQGNKGVKQASNALNYYCLIDNVLGGIPGFCLYKSGQITVLANIRGNCDLTPIIQSSLGSGRSGAVIDHVPGPRRRPGHRRRSGVGRRHRRRHHSLG